MPEPKSVAVVIVAESPYTPGKFALLRCDPPNLGHWFIWCGRSMGWLPLKETRGIFVRLYKSEEAADKAIKQTLPFPLQEEEPCSPS
jgi:hypothetical protein